MTLREEQMTQFYSIRVILFMCVLVSIFVLSTCLCMLFVSNLDIRLELVYMCSVQIWSKPNHSFSFNKLSHLISSHGLLAWYVKLRVAHAPWIPGTFSPPPRVNDPDMHHGTCMTHVPWCMPGSLTSGFLLSRCRENVPGIPGACATVNCVYLVRGPLETSSHS